MPSASDIRAGGVYVEIYPDTSRLKKDLADETSIIEALKGSFGRGSAFYEAMHTLEGGGAAIGLGLAGRELNELTKKALELRNEFVEGKKSGGEIADELLKSVPILGNIYSAGRNIHELVFGMDSELQHAREHLSLLSDEADAMKAAFKGADDALADMGRLIDDLAGKHDLIGAGPLERGLAQARTGAAGEFKAVNDAFTKGVEDVAKPIRDKLKLGAGDVGDLLGGKQRDLQKQIADMDRSIAQTPIKNDRYYDAFGGFRDATNAPQIEAMKSRRAELQQELKGLEGDAKAYSQGVAEVTAKRDQAAQEVNRGLALNTGDALAKSLSEQIKAGLKIFEQPKPGKAEKSGKAADEFGKEFADLMGDIGETAQRYQERVAADLSSGGNAYGQFGGRDFSRNMPQEIQRADPELLRLAQRQTDLVQRLYNLITNGGAGLVLQ